MSFSAKPYFYHLAGAIFFLFFGNVAHADMLSTSMMLSSVAKKTPVAAPASTSVARPVPRSAGGQLVQASKRKPGQIKRSGFNLNNISPTSLRRKLSSRSAIIMDTYSGQILYAHEPDRTGQPASTIKILTGLIAMKSLRDTSIVKVSHKASRMPRSKIYLHQGREYKADDMINAVLIASANDASVALAEQIAGSEQTFTKLMNHKARELGARSTDCKSASGLTVRGQKSTVRDLAIIFNGAMQDEEFAHRIGKVRARTSYGRQLKNHNRALWRIDGALAGKTGYTHLARQTYVGMFQREGQAITVALMGSETMWDDLSNLVEYGFVRRGQFVAGGKL
ncbi:MAG: hypothetical protein RI601_12530, partial [Desulfurivibrionaceae bacterium]|nr:hypothetical protein [Desulfurivibrionaceae bacterium]